jgi:hypothetical protein
MTIVYVVIEVDETTSAFVCHGVYTSNIVAMRIASGNSKMTICSTTLDDPQSIEAVGIIPNCSTWKWRDDPY